MPLYYKILCGYGSERAIQITADELEKAYGIFLLGGRAIFSGGAVDGKLIHMIVPDWHRIMGWTPEHRLDAYDWDELRQKGLDYKAREVQRGMHIRVSYLVANGKQNLIGTGAKLPELESPHIERREGTVKQIGEVTGELKKRYE